MKKLPIFYNALLLTGVNLLLRLVSTSFQVFLSGRIGAAGIGLLQLVLSVASMTMTAGMAGIRTATMYLTAEELGKGRPQNVTWVLSACFGYSLIFSGTVGTLVYGFAPWIAENWIGDLRTLGAIRLFAAFLPVSCFVGVMVGYFTAANRISALAAVEVAEQICSMVITTMALLLWAGQERGRACLAVVAGSCAGSLLTLLFLVLLRLGEKPKTGPSISVTGRLAQTALPLALADDVKVGINTVENLMVPRRLALFTDHALAQFGLVSGMVFPVLMFPAALVYGLVDLLIPEMARCNAAGSQRRIRYLTRRSLRAVMLYGLACGGFFYLMGEGLCIRLYQNPNVGNWLRIYGLLAPMLYCDAIVDAMNKGLGLQQTCVRFNIFTAVLDVVGLYILLPRFGMWGYFLSFFLSHAINAALSLWLLLHTTGLRIRPAIPVNILIAMAASLFLAQSIPVSAWKPVAFFLLAGGFLWFGGIVGTEDLHWLTGMIFPEKNPDIL